MGKYSAKPSVLNDNNIVFETLCKVCSKNFQK